MPKPGTRGVRPLLVAAALLAVGAGTCWYAWRTAHSLPARMTATLDDSRLDALVVEIASLALVLAVGGLAMSGDQTAVAGWLNRRQHDTRPARVGIGPARWRSLVLAACGLALATPQAVASDRAPGDRAPGRPDGMPRLTGLPLPDLPTSPGGQYDDGGPRFVIVVRPGDSLWAIARRALPSHAPDVEVARAVDRLYARNRDVVGPDPDLIQPGTQLNGGQR
jgi:hypothetical protein